MSRILFYLLTTVALTVVLGYILHVPLPEKLTERPKMQIFDAVLRLAYAYPVQALGNLGARYQLWWTRTSLKFLAKLMAPHWTLEDPELLIREREMAGVRVREYVPKGERGSDGAILFIHGGGFVLMDTGDYDSLTRTLARESKMALVSIDYRLAPEHIFPAGLEDCLRVVRHFLREGHKELGVDPRKVTVMGDSAGGNLAAVVTQHLRDDPDLPHLNLQVLLYPLLQYLDFLTPSYQLYYKEYADSAFLDPQSIARWVMMYAGIEEPGERRIAHLLANNHTTVHARRRRQTDAFHHVHHDHLPLHYKQHPLYAPPPEPYGDEDVFAELEEFLFNPDFSPLMQPDLRGLPPALIVTCEYDILRDEGYWYARRLREEGRVPVTLKHYDAGFHAMLNFHVELDVSRRALKDIASFVLQHS